MNAESQNRTGDTMIFSHVLYQLSYLGRPVSVIVYLYFTQGFGDCLGYFSNIPLSNDV